ncbi:hypothetical protein Z946_3796 [Sulfitobacter noctilucicola]|nr:hypothetical protein Z946_3796 [Sulfitobacter noctilucicola]
MQGGLENKWFDQNLCAGFVQGACMIKANRFERFARVRVCKPRARA